MSLEDRLRREIAANGPLTVAQYMTRCLHDPQDGYYAARPALGAAGDFITAPLTSQMFGELLGLWTAESWRRMGAPSRFILAEAGPGDGTLMADALRALRLEPGCLEAAELYLVETSSPLIQAQQRRLGGAAPSPHWVPALESLPQDPPLILLANELLDCLPARQFVRAAGGWAERVVGLDDAGRLTFGLSPTPAADALPDAGLGAVYELSAAQAAFAAAVGDRIARTGGAALLIDYGRDEPGFGDTLQALRGHSRIDPLSCPGQADLTVHVDFPAVRDAARAAGAQAGPILDQATFLGRLGIEARAQALARNRPDVAPILMRQLERLTSPDQMGTLFKVLPIYASADFVPPGFEEA